MADLELREHVAVRVMGLTVHRYAGDEWVGVLLCRLDKGAGGTTVVPAYETEISAAWLVVEKLWHNFWPEGTGGQRYECHIHPDADGWHCAVCLEAVGIPIAEAVAPTAPLAICRAALAAMESTNG